MPDRDPCPLCGSKLGILPYDREGQVDIKPAISATMRAIIEETYRNAYDDAIQLIEPFVDQSVEALKQELRAQRDRPFDWSDAPAPLKLAD